MKSDRTISDKRQKLIDELNTSEIKVGETIVAVLPDAYKKDDGVSLVVISKDGDSLLVKRSDSSIHNNEYTISVDDVEARDTRYIGANPFDETDDKVRPVAFTFESILFNLDILGNKRDSSNFEKYKMNGIVVKELNWNPYIYKNDKKEYYQRDFVWSLKDNQRLIESIYQSIDCGKLLVRKRGWKELEQMAADGETELAFYDIVDGKQRLNAIREFMLGKFADLDGNFYSDLSAHSQWKLTDHQLFSYSELPEVSEDSSIIRQFLKLNFTGVEQSIEHINFVKSLKETQIEEQK